MMRGPSGLSGALLSLGRCEGDSWSCWPEGLDNADSLAG